jgi:hypothetical protein
MSTEFHCYRNRIDTGIDLEFFYVVFKQGSNRKNPWRVYRKDWGVQNFRTLRDAKQFVNGRMYSAGIFAPIWKKESY